MTDRRTRRAVARLDGRYDRLTMMHIRGRLNAERTPWFKTPPRLPIAMTAARVEITPDQAAVMERAVPGSYAWAKELARTAAALGTEHWADTKLHRPTSSLNHRTARFAGKPYHWRQDYTGQLKLAAGESPWGTNVH